MQTDSSRSPFWIPNETIPVRDLTNQEFLERFARAGRIGLATGSLPLDGLAAKTARPVASATAAGPWGDWTHAFIFEGTRVDGLHWIVATELSPTDKHVQLGVQECRINRFFDAKKHPCLAVLDFGLSQEQTLKLVREALDLVANRTTHSPRELLTAFSALRNPALRGKESVLSRDPSFFCSAFAAHLFRKIGMDIVPGLTVKHTPPGDLARSETPHQTYILQRGLPPGRLNIARKKSAKIPDKLVPRVNGLSPRLAALKPEVRPAVRK